MQVTKSKELSLREKLLPETSYYISNASDIAELRKAVGATQEEFARIIGVVASTVHRWEKGIGKPESKMARKLGRLKEIVDLLQAGFQVGSPAATVRKFTTCACGPKEPEIAGLTDGQRAGRGCLRAAISGGGAVCQHPTCTGGKFTGWFTIRLTLFSPWGK